MRVIGLELGSVKQLVDILELSPPEGIFAVELAGAIVDRYGFTPVQNEGSEEVMRFARGRLPDGRKGLITLFEVHPHGLVVNSIDTSISEDFLTDLMEMGEKDFGLRQPSPLSKKIYTSNIAVEFEKNLDGMISKWRAMSGILNAYLTDLYQITAGANLNKIAFRPDHNSLPSRLSGLLSDFVLERRVYAPHDSQRFYSVAPLPTAKHIEFLKKLEALA